MTTVCLPDYGIEQRVDDLLSLLNQLDRPRGFEGLTKSSLLVCEGNTVSRHNNGLSRKELHRLSGAARTMERSGHPLHWAVLGDELLNVPSAAAREQIDRFLSYLVKAQGRAGLPKYWTIVFETSGGLHANIVFVGDGRLAHRLRRSFPSLMKAGYGKGAAMQPVDDMIWLATHYLAKERTSQASWKLGNNWGAREKGSHRLPGGGDRVRLSLALRTDAIAAGAIRPWIPKYANRRAQ